ncbi:lactate dehydrogenase [Photobacterium arenosum]|uniref:lactate dehydrogenase n=1 Tax=Photobacterium arenosum TaxID=2774143 RepID=UPI00288B92F7|nr:lactate dehydrogenase [Photobacterium arenosum]
MMTNQKHSATLPPASGHWQLNHCKTVRCQNFGSRNPDDYIIQRTNPNRPAFICKECGAFPPLISNKNVIAEWRYLKLQQSNGLPACNNLDCDNLGLPVLTHRHLYHAFGYSGDRQRYRCKNCQTTFVDRWSGFNPKHQIQQKLLALLFTGHPIRDICRRLGMNPKTFYDQLNHIASRCRRQLSVFDARLLQHKSQLALACTLNPLQPHAANGVYWIASCEANSGYVLSQHINYHPEQTGTPDTLHDPYSPNARFLARQENSAPTAAQAAPQGLLAKVDAKYREVLSRPHLEDPSSDQNIEHFPAKGNLIRPQYAVYAHFLQLNEQVSDNTQLMLFMPQEPLLRSACLSVFLNRIRSGTIEPVYVEEDTEWPQGNAAGRIDIVLLGWWRDRWAFTRFDQVGKGICHLGGEKNNEARWLQLATHREVDEYQQRFYQQFAQLVDEPRRKARPGGLLPLLDIYRAWHNLCRQDRNGLTPAQQLGIMASPLTLEQLLN